MSRVRTEAPKTQNNQGHYLGRRVGEDTSGWRCPGCTFHNTGDVCTMCNEARPKVQKPIKQKPNAKPIYGEKKAPKQSGNSDVYYDPTDGSFNVPIAGIKKYDHKPGKNDIKKPEEVKKKSSSPVKSNIVTLNSLKAQDNIEERKIPNEKPEMRKINGKRDLLGLLQDAASDEPLPCMRKPKPKK